MKCQYKLFELKRYSLEDMASRLGLTKLETVKLWESKEIESFKVENGKNSRDLHYYFDYVGVIVHPKMVIHVIPAYLEGGTEEEIERDYRLSIRAIEKYKRQSDVREHTLAESYSYQDREVNNQFELMIELLRDYFQNDLYTTEQHLYEEDGFGEINWDMTIDNYYPLITNNRPIYPSVITESVDKEEATIIQRIHRTLIGISYNTLNEANLLELLGISIYEERWESLSDIGSIPYLKQLIRQEMNIQFETRKLYVLDTLLALLTEFGKSKNKIQTYEFGTHYFANVWEAACQRAFNNQLGEKLSNLSMLNKSLLLQEGYENKRLTDIIEKVVWTFNEDPFEKGGPIPDIVTLLQKDDNVFMYIFDAKYYNVSIGAERIEAVPGFNDVIKQYMYELAFRKFNNQLEIKFAYNAFLFPTLETNQGETTVEFPPINNLAQTKLKPITALEIPAHQIYESYLSEKAIDWQKSINPLQGNSYNEAL